MKIPYDVKRLREGTEQVWVYNSSGLVFLYDEGNADAIAAAAPFILEGFRGEADLVDPVLCKLARNGLLLAYELYQDDEILLEVSIGGPALDPVESGGAKYLGPKLAHLELPTGRMHVASHDTIRIGGREPGDPDAVLEVPPGSYAVSITWLDRNSAGNDVDGAKFPSEFIALTPARKSEKRPAHAVVTHPEREDHWDQAVKKSKTPRKDEMRLYYDYIQKKFRNSWKPEPGTGVQIDFIVQPDGSIAEMTVNGAADEARAQAALSFLRGQKLKPLPPMLVEKLGKLPVAYLF